MTEIVNTDPRFSRARCEHCAKLYPVEQTDIYKLTRLADAISKRVRLCFVCSHSMPANFSVTKVAD